MYVFEMNDPELNDRFVIRVSVPAMYEMQKDKSYPVLYVVDSDAAFGAACTTVDYINLGANFGLGKNVPDLITVGIGYERGMLPWLFTRVRDFTPSEDPSFNYNNPQFKISESGKADIFYTFLTKEVIPAIQENFRVDDTLSILSGHSMGGLFGLYAMLKKDCPFNKFIAISPFVGWDTKVLFKHEQDFAAAQKEIQADLFMSSCGIEPTPTYIEEVREYYTILKERGYKQFRSEYREYPEENHFSILPKAFSEGLYAIFNL